MFHLFNFLVELVLKRLGLEDLLNNEKKYMEEIAAIRDENCDIDPFEFRKDSASKETHIAQTQAILANIHRQNQEQSCFRQNEEKEGGVKRKKSNDEQSKPPKQFRFSMSRICLEEDAVGSTSANRSEHESNKNWKVHGNDTVLANDSSSKMSTSIPDPKNESSEEVPSILGSPIISSTLKESVNSSDRTTKSIFKYSQGDFDADIFDL